jgi:hypothetical protein
VLITASPFILAKLIFGVSGVGTQLAKLELAIFLVHCAKTSWQILKWRLSLKRQVCQIKFTPN